MIIRLRLLCLSALGLLCASAAGAAPGLVTGDSLGVGVSMASHLHSFAKNSVSIRSSGAIEQIERATAGSVVFLSLGTNDAVSNINGLDGGIDRIVQAATKAQVQLVWIGPPCVFKPWDKNASALDGILKEKLKGSGVTYVSMRGDNLCDRSVRAKDGVHFNMTGYHAMWDAARSAAGFQAEAGDTAPAADAGASEKPHKKKRHRVRKHKKAPSATAPAADAPADAAPAAPAPQ